MEITTTIKKERGKENHTQMLKEEKIYIYKEFVCNKHAILEKCLTNMTDYQIYGSRYIFTF